MNNTVSFGAKFIRELPIKKYSYTDKVYKDDVASLVELDPQNVDDLKALEDIAIDFGGDTYVNNIFVDAKLKSTADRKDTKFKILALTTQTDSFDKLNSGATLGVAKISKIKEKEIELEYLQVHPRFVYSFGPAFVKHTGSAIIDYLKLMNDKICLIASPSSHIFYKKNGFKKLSQNGNHMIWVKHNNVK